MQRKLKIMFFLIASVLVIQTAYASSVTITNLGTLPGGSFSYASGINDNGQIVGYGQDAAHNCHAILWTVTAAPVPPIADFTSNVTQGFAPLTV